MSKKNKNIKKRVTFSDDTTITTHQTHKKKDLDYDRPPVYMRKTITTIPLHLLALLYYYIKISDNYDTLNLLFTLIPLQIAYLIFQFNKSTIYGNKRLKTNIPLLLITVGGSIALSVPAMIIIILFGAPFVEHIFQTWLLALHASFLAYPALYSVFNCDFKVGLWKKYFIAIMIGGWISCVVIPLDWDRDWQVWPIPVVIGIYLGAFVGYSITAYI